MSISLTDTHCHIHEAARPLKGDDPTRSLWAKAADASPDAIITRALEAGVERLICVGTTLHDSQLAVRFAADHPEVWASIGLHPHEAEDYANFSDKLKKFAELATQPKVVAIGECGLDYFYEHSPRQDQEKVLRFQLELAQQHNLPLIFHVRDAFDDFWPIFDSYRGLRGVVHSFSATTKELGQIIERGLYVGLNGIMTFTKNQAQLEAAKTVPLSKLLLETDAPFLTPAPFRGNICEPKHVRVTGEFLAGLRSESLADIATATTANARDLFGL